jgi:PAS domain S-box-containing protein
VAQLEKELEDKEEYLHTVIDELEELNRELTSANEELESTNEELQSTNEELETSKEELQSTNEELSTINAELQFKNEELSGLNNDIYNLLNSTEIATLFLDLEIRIRRFTPAIQRIYPFLQTDAGRPLAHFISNLNYDHLVEDARRVLENLIPRMKEVQATDGSWYLITLRPYRTVENIIDGVVVTFVDISQQKHLNELRRLVTVIQDSNDAITVQDFTGKILAWNRGATQMYGWNEAEALTMNALDLIPESKRAEALAAFQRLARGEAIRSFETQRVTRDRRVLDVWMTLTVLFDEDHHPDRIATTERDITAMKEAGQRQLFENRALMAAHRWYQAAFEHGKPGFQAEVACRFLVEEAGYRLAWLGKTEKSQVEGVTPVAWAGLEGGAHGKKVALTLARLAAGLVQEVLSSGKPAAMRNLQSNPEYRQGRKNALANDYGALLVLPLINPIDPVGILAIYAREPDAFTDQETEILWAVSQSIGRADGSLVDPTDGQ